MIVKEPTVLLMNLRKFYIHCPSTFWDTHLVFTLVAGHPLLNLITLVGTPNMSCKPLPTAINSRTKHHRSPLHLLLQNTNVKPGNYKTILTTRRRCNYQVLANILIEKDRETAIAKANTITGGAIFTDGSGFEDNIGAAAVMFRNGHIEKTIKYHLKSNKMHTVYKAEAIMVILTLHLPTELNKVLINVTIGLDNQAVLLGL